VNTFTFTPVQYFMATESAVTAKRDLNARPDHAQAFDQQGQDRPAEFGAINIAGAQVGLAGAFEQKLTVSTKSGYAKVL
jgi:hypothetical protein